MKKLVILEPLNVELNEEINSLKEKFKDKLEIIEYKTKSTDKDELIKRIGDADFLVTDNTKLDEEVFHLNSSLKYIFVVFTGLDHLPLEYLKSRNIEVFNAQGYASESVAELILFYILYALKRFNELDYSNEIKVMGEEISSKKIGIIGMGGISKALLNLLSSFKSTKIFYTSKNKHDEINNEFSALDISYLDKESLLKESDIVILNIPLISETKGYLSKKEFDLMKKDTILINCGRGAIVDKVSLLNALNNDKIRLYLTDVFENEPPKNKEKELDLINSKKIIYSPHIGFYTKEAMERRKRIVFDKVNEELNKIL